MSHSLPEGLQEAIKKDSQPVRPLRPAWKRAAWVAGIATMVVVLALVVMGVRPDIAQIPIWLSWGSCLLQLCFGVVLVGMALREAVPGSVLPIRTIALGISIAFALQVIVGLLTWRYAPGMALDPWALGPGLACMGHDALLVLPTFLVTLVLIFKALPLRAPVAGMMGGAGAAMTADAINHLLCPASDMRHVLLWHTGAIALFIAAGFVIGMVWERIRWRTQ